MSHNRRSFLQTSLGASAVVALGAAPPRFLLQAAAQATGQGGDNVLVVLQLTGGNDGLNTVIPYADDEYHKRRPSLALSASNVLRVDDDFGFHPALRGFANLLEKQMLAVVQGVGYANPNRSHFESMDIWHTCVRDERQRAAGWLGRYLDATQEEQASSPRALHFGAEKQPLALAGSQVRTPSLRSLEQFRLQGADEQLTALVQDLTRAERTDEDSLLQFIQSSENAALDASRRVASRLREYSPATPYPGYALAEKLKLAAQLIDSGVGASIYYVELDGFDTHSQQAPAHEALLRQLGDSLAAFVNDMDAHGHGKRLMVMGFSEFGRRVEENASEGTDHGAAAPMFVAGARVQPGLIGKHPSLTDLQDGDLKHHTDFRQVYAAVLEQWLGWKSEPILGKHYEPVNLLQG